MTQTFNKILKSGGLHDLTTELKISKLDNGRLKETTGYYNLFEEIEFVSMINHLAGSYRDF